MRFKPSYEVEPIPDAPELGKRIYASCVVESISAIGLMTLKMNETVVVLPDYSFVTKQDFEVIFIQNSDEEEV